MTAASLAGSRRILGLFAKQPRAGHVKTRLAAAWSPEAAAAVAETFLLDTLDRLSRFAGERVLAFAPPHAHDYFQQVVRERFRLLPQAEGDLGARMAAFFAGQFADGAESVVLLGTDSPTLPFTFVEQAFRELHGADVVLGPATDGGYYLIGCARWVPSLFEAISWGTSRVLWESIGRLADSEWRLALLPPWYDVDTLDDWQMLQGHIAAQRRAGLDPAVPHTERLFLR
jgi:rSAM/selenodomain-associated transferase 1